MSRRTVVERHEQTLEFGIACRSPIKLRSRILYHGFIKAAKAPRRIRVELRCAQDLDGP